MASHESYTSFPFGLHGILVDLSCTRWLKSIQIFLWSLVFSCIFLLMTLNINKNCFLLMMRYVCYLIQNTISMFRWNKVKLKKYIEDILQVTTFKNKYARPYGINSRVEHSGIIMTQLEKNDPIHTCLIAMMSHDACAFYLVPIHTYWPFCDQGTWFLIATTSCFACSNLLTFF
jgi:hypothetical protein